MRIRKAIFDMAWPGEIMSRIRLWNQRGKLAVRDRAWPFGGGKAALSGRLRTRL
jgi:hypothetical protein